MANPNRQERVKPATPQGIVFLTGFALLAFAGNSLLTRAALSQALIGAGAFAGIRLASGALMLIAANGFAWRRALPGPKDGPAIFALLIYMGCFSFAYKALGAANGALILFASVQISMAAIAAARGEPPSARQAGGLALAFGGLIWLLAPGISAPPLVPGALMAAAGAAWGIYTLLGRAASDAIAANARNFLGAAPLGLALLWLEPAATPSAAGIGLAIGAGAVTSGLGYAIWYRALAHLSPATAGAVQLLVPVVAAAGANLWLGEQLSIRLLLACIAILTGIALTLRFRRETAPAA